MLTREEALARIIANNGQVPADVAAVLGGLNKKLDNDQSIKRSVTEKLTKQLGLEFTYKALVSSKEPIDQILKRLGTLKLYFDHPDYKFDDKQNKLLDSALPKYEDKEYKGVSYRDLADMMTANPALWDFEADIEKSHKDVLWARIKKSGKFVVKHADLSLKKDREFMLDAVKIDFNALKYADQILLKDWSFMLTAVGISSFALEHADLSLKKDREFMLDAAKINFNALEYADQILLKDREFMLDAAKINFNALEYADQSLREDFDFMLRLAKEIDIEAVDICVDDSLWERLLDNEEIALLVVKKDGLLLKILPEKHRNDPKIVLSAVEQDEGAKAYIGMDLQAKINEAGGFDEFKKQQVKNSTSDRRDALSFFSHSNSPSEPSKKQEMS